MMFEKGQLIVYGATGVCRVAEIAAMDDSGRLFYKLEPLYQKCDIFTPAQNDKVFMRPVISRQEAESLIGDIPNIRAEACLNPVLRELSGLYEATLKSCDCRRLLELTMSIYAKKQIIEQQKRKFGTVDANYFKKAEDLLYGELAAALGIAKEGVSDYIAARLEALSGPEEGAAPAVLSEA